MRFLGCHGMSARSTLYSLIGYLFCCIARLLAIVFECSLGSSEGSELCWLSPSYCLLYTVQSRHSLRRWLWMARRAVGWPTVLRRLGRSTPVAPTVALLSSDPTPSEAHPVPRARPRCVSACSGYGPTGPAPPVTTEDTAGVLNVDLSFASAAAATATAPGDELIALTSAHWSK